MRVGDPARFMAEIVGTDGEFTADEISFQIRNVIVQEFSRAIASSNIPVLDMAANTKELGQLVAKAIAPVVAQYGLVLPEFYVENISLPEAVEKMLDTRTSMGIVGDLNRFNQYATGAAMIGGAENPGGGIGAGIGAGMGAAIGAGMAGQVARSGPWGQMPASASYAGLPPPLPAETVWHVAVNGEADGPYGRGHLGRMVRDGSFTRDTLVWRPGQDGWTRAEDVTELAQLFTVMPPPPPIPPSLPSQ